MKRFLNIVVICLLSLLLFISCSAPEPMPDTTAIAVLALSPDLSHRLKEYDSPYTVGTKNRDGTFSLYIFSSPVQYPTEDGYTMIDNGLIKSSEPSFAYENAANEIKCYFPQRLEDGFKIIRGKDWMQFVPSDTKGYSTAQRHVYTNLFGDKVDAVIYKRKSQNLIFYATSAGIKMEIVLMEMTESINFTVETSCKTYEDKQNGYIRFLNGETNTAVIYQPLAKNDEGDVSIGTKMKISKTQERYSVEIFIDPNLNGQYPIRMDPSFELYRNKMPDTSIYSCFNVNSYLRQYAVVGQHPVLGEGWEYMRFRINRFTAIRPNNILSATYHMKLLSDLSDDYQPEMISMDQDWSSAQMLWSTRIQPGGRIGCPETEIPGVFDITSFVKNSVTDEMNISEAEGCVLRAKGSDYMIYASSDNSQYTPYIHLKLSAKPQAFVPRDNINP